MSTLFTHTLRSLLIATDPSVPFSDEHERVQHRGYASSGEQYRYSKSTLKKTVHTLAFNKLTLSESIDLDNFHDLVDGVHSSFVWTDGNGVLRTVRFTQEALDIEQKNGSWGVTFKLEEEL